MLSLSAVSKRFDDVLAVDDVSFSVAKGEACFLLGKSGCGKTTILRMIAGLERPSEGFIYLGEKNITELPPEQRAIGLVFQNFALWPHLTVKQHVAFGLAAKKMSTTAIASRVKEVLALTGLGQLENRKPHELSGGQQQRVALARALAPNPEILLLDEPFSNLDGQLKQELAGELQRLQRELGLTYIFVTHDRTEALSQANHILLLHEGSVRADGKPEKIYFAPPDFWSYSFLGEYVQLGQDGRTVCYTRPELFSLKRPEGTHRQFQGAVSKKQFLGAFTKLFVSSAAKPGDDSCAATFHAVVPTREAIAYQEGTAILLYVLESDIFSG